MMQHLWAPSPDGSIFCVQCGMAYLDRSEYGDDCQPRPQPSAPPTPPAQPAPQPAQPGYTTISTPITHAFDYDCKCAACSGERIRRANEAIRRNS